LVMHQGHREVATTLQFRDPGTNHRFDGEAQRGLASFGSSLADLDREPRGLQNPILVEHDNARLEPRTNACPEVETASGTAPGWRQGERACRGPARPADLGQHDLEVMLGAVP